ncbi:MAG: tetratricopeptide repeat protein, partial [Nitrospiraceae bacterium]|nr:tetratricopeptide repeat protein [Nitrospiraceae bacterium]
MGDGETPSVAESRALLKAKQIAVEQAGTYVESYTKIHDMSVVEDDIEVLATGIMEIRILDKKRMIAENGIKFWVKIEAKVESNKLSEAARKLKDRIFSQDVRKLKDDYSTSQREIEDLKRQLAKEKKKGKRRQIEKEIASNEKSFAATELVSNANQYIENKEYEKAEDALGKAIQFNPKYVFAYLKRSLIYASTKSYDKALKDANTAISLVADEPTPYAIRGYIYMNKGELEKAIDDNNMALSLKPTEQEALWSYKILTQAYFNIGLYDDAIKTASRFLAVAQNDSGIYYLRGRSFAAKKQNEHATKDYTATLSIDPNSAFAYLGRCKAVADNDDALKGWAEAMPDCAKACSLGLTDACTLVKLARKAYPHGRVIEALRKKADEYRSRKDYDKVIETCTLVIADDPRDWDCYYSRAEAYINKDECGNAFDDYAKGIQFAPTEKLRTDMMELKTTAVSLCGSRLAERGGQLYQKGNDDEALDFLGKAIELEPTEAAYYHVRGEVFLGKKDYGSAIRDFDNALTYRYQSDLYKNVAADVIVAEIYLGRGLAYSNLGNDQQAKKDYEKALEMRPNIGADLFSRANSGAKSGRFRESLFDYDKVLALKPRLAEAYVRRGTVLQKLGEMTQSANDCGKAIALDSHLEEAFLCRANAWAATGNFDDAIQDYKKVIDLDPKNEIAYNLRGLAYARSGNHRAAKWDFELTPSVWTNMVECQTGSKARNGRKGSCHEETEVVQFRVQAS